MAIKFKCPHCQKPLSVKDELAGKKAACPACKKGIVIPAPVAPPVDVEAFAAAALADPTEVKSDKPPQFVEFPCPICDEKIKFGIELAGKQSQCPSCKNIVKVPLPKREKPKDWRGSDKHGPSAALINLPEQLDGAWGTEIKGRVGRESLEDAGVIEDVVEPIGVSGWIRRGFYSVAVLGVVAIVAFAVVRNRGVAQQKGVIKDAREWATEAAKDPKKKPHPVLVAEIDRADGLLQLQQGKVGDARDQFFKARLRSDGGKDKDASFEQDLFLIDLALAQLEMGGTEDDIRGKTRYDWMPTVFKEVSQTLDRIKSPDAKAFAARLLVAELLYRKQKPMAQNVVNKLIDPGQPGAAKPVAAALVFASGDWKAALKTLDPEEKLKQEPNPKQPLPDKDMRIAFAEGHARKGALEEAWTFVDAKGFALHRVEAGVAVAVVLVTEKGHKDPAAQGAKAARFVQEALVILNDPKQVKGAPPWLTYQLCYAAMRTPHAGEAKTYAEKAKLPAHFTRRLQLEWVRAQLDKGDAKSPEDIVKTLPDGEGPARCLAWVAIGQKFGGSLKLPEEPGEAVFARIGQALNGAENKK